MIKKDSAEYQKIMAQIEAASKGVAYEEPYDREINGDVYTIVGHNGTEYIALLNNQIKYIPAGDLF